MTIFVKNRILDRKKLECEVLKFKLFLRNDCEHHDGSKTCSIGSIIVERDDVGTRGGTIERKSSV